jgi:hypothetical protein
MDPASRTFAVGSSVMLDVAVTGTAPFTYQWTKNAAPMAGETNATLVIASAQAGDAGSYRVTVSNVAGSATSAAAILVVVSPPTITAIERSGAAVTVFFTTQPGPSYRVEYTDDLNAPVWTPLPGSAAGTGAIMSLMDPASPPARRFYRARAE